MVILIIFSNEFIEIIEENNKVFVKNLKVGFPLKNFDGIMKESSSN